MPGWLRPVTWAVSPASVAPSGSSPAIVSVYADGGGGVVVVLVDVVDSVAVLVVLLVVEVLVAVAVLVDDVEAFIVVVTALMVIVGVVAVDVVDGSVLVVEVVAAGVVVTAAVVGEREVVEDVVGMSVVDWIEAFCGGAITMNETVATARIIKMTMAAPAVVPFMYASIQRSVPQYTYASPRQNYLTGALLGSLD